MPKTHVERTIVIKASVSEVFNQLNDFHSWIKWSPWLITEPDANVNVREDGKYYEWSGKVVGSGNMSVLSEVNDEKIDYDLTFLTPFKSKAKVGFHLVSTPVDGETKVSWTMDSKLPFFLFFMKKRMEIMIGMDFDRGLKMLKEQVEEGKIKSRVDVKGSTEFPGSKYIGIRTSTDIPNMATAHKSDFEKLMGFVRENNIELSGIPYTMYQKWDPMKGLVEYTAVAPVKVIPGDLPSGFIQSESKGFKGYSIMHTGAYHHLGNAWSAAYSRQYGKVFKADKKNYPVELYYNSPIDTPQEELITEIIMPVKE